MEFLFTGQLASIEAILVLICVGVFIAIFSYDGYIFLNRFFRVIFPKRSIPNLREEKEVLAQYNEPKWESLPLSLPIKSAPMYIEEDIPKEVIVPPEVTEVPESETSEASLKSSHPKIIEETKEGIKSGEYDEKIEEIEETIESNITQEKSSYENTEIEEKSIPENIATENISGDATTIWEEDIQDEVLPIQEEADETTDVLSTEKSLPQEELIDKKRETVPEQIETTIPPTHEEPSNPSIPLRNNHTETLFALINNIKTLIARWQILEARGLIIQWLALEKDNRELNVILAWLYEQDRHFEKAEYIYKDLALMYPNDTEILEKLGNVLIIEKRYEIAMEIYKKILTLNGETEGTLYILAHLANEMKEYEVAYAYSKRYLKQWPNNPEILTLISTAEVALGKRQDAIQTLIKLKNLTPYNHEIAQMIQKLVVEEELANNFGEEK